MWSFYVGTWQLPLASMSMPTFTSHFPDALCECDHIEHGRTKYSYLVMDKVETHNTTVQYVRSDDPLLNKNWLTYYVSLARLVLYGEVYTLARCLGSGSTCAILLYVSPQGLEIVCKLICTHPWHSPTTRLATGRDVHVSRHLCSTRAHLSNNGALDALPLVYATGEIDDASRGAKFNMILMPRGVDVYDFRTQTRSGDVLMPVNPQHLHAQTSRSLSALYAAGLEYHGDIKMENVVMFPARQVVPHLFNPSQASIIDYGGHYTIEHAPPEVVRRTGQQAGATGTARLNRSVDLWTLATLLTAHMHPCGLTWMESSMWVAGTAVDESHVPAKLIELEWFRRIRNRSGRVAAQPFARECREMAGVLDDTLIRWLLHLYVTDLSQRLTGGGCCRDVLWPCVETELRRSLQLVPGLRKPARLSKMFLNYKHTQLSANEVASIAVAGVLATATSNLRFALGGAR